MPDLSQIADLSGVALRKLRYVLDHGLLPGGEDASRGRGAARSFMAVEAFVIVTAALMLEAGLKRALVRDCLAALDGSRRMKIADVPLCRAYAADLTARLEVGDWSYVRLSGTGRLRTSTFDTGWLPLAGGGAAVVTYAPLVTVAIDVGQISRRVGTDF